MSSQQCPDCGSSDIDETSRNLSTLGYLAEDVTYLCANCGHTWACGEPVGEFDHPIVEDTTCDSCGDFGWLYQLHEGVNGLALRFKCDSCNYVWVIERKFVDGAITVGYPFLMGDAAKPYGYEDQVHEHGDT